MSRFNLPQRPLVVGTLASERNLASQIKRAAHAYVDIVELRLDTFPWVARPLPIVLTRSKELLEKIKKATRKPILLTLRSHTECGRKVPRERRLTDERRIQLLTPLLSLVRFVDLEIRRFPFVKKMTTLAHRHGVHVIHSFHEFNGIFRADSCETWVRKSKAIRGDIFKVAISPKTNTELEDFLAWGNERLPPARILIGMGKVGFPSRTLGFSFGSIFSYGHLGTSAAPGQMPAAELGRVVRELYGRRRI